MLNDPYAGASSPVNFSPDFKFFGDIIIRVSNESDCVWAYKICEEIEQSARERGTGIAQRSVDYIASKIRSALAIVAVNEEAGSEGIAGFCYIESWDHGRFVANSGLVVFPEFRKIKLATKLKTAAFELSRKLYPHAKLFGLTTSLAVMKINSRLGYTPVTFEQLTTEDDFWQGCKGCVNYPTLESKNHKNCLCTAMLFDPMEGQVTS